jgi:hypothetical protein
MVLGFAIALIAIRTQFGSEKRFTKELSDQIEPGMSLARVIDILGCPPGDYTTEPYRHFPPSGHPWPDDFKRWMDDYGEIKVEFDEEEKVVRVLSYRFDPPRRRSWFEIAWDRLSDVWR